ncbi:tat pathway signal sequence [Xylariales sp. PMI_506]|nr:tat pathway signal sequence [Xylariales sp. PMI_506]
MFIGIYNSGKKSPSKILNADLRATSSYSPVFDMIDLEPTIKKVNGTVYAEGELSIARQFPNPVADAIWEEDIELIRPIPITREQIIKMGKNPDTVAKLEHDVWGLGDNAYVAALDIFHNLHCLNSLRQVVYGKYYNLSQGDVDRDDWTHEVHINHCVDILYQTISCSNNINMVTRHWTEGREYPFPDFSINKHCINFEKLKSWHKEASIDMKKYMEVMKKPKGVKEQPKEVWHPKEWFDQPHTSS